MLWHPWSVEAFDRARERQSPVLLFLRADWCRWCRELEQTVLANARVASVLSERYVCIAADKDQFPQVDERYRRGGWPTLAWLDGEGELLGSLNTISADAMRELCVRIAGIYPAGRGEIQKILQAEQAPPTLSLGSDAKSRPRRKLELGLELVEEVTRSVVQSADPIHGGWGVRQKFPHPEALQFAMVRWTQTGDPETRAVVLRTLHHMQAGEIFDSVEGGFYRYATQPDWSVPVHEKPLDSNAERLLTYVQAAQVFGEASFLATAGGSLRWMMGTLLDPGTGAFRAGQDADPEYAHLKSLEARARRARPPCDPAIYTHSNAMAAVALMESSIALGEERLRAQALQTLDFLLENLWDARAGMFHSWDGTYNLPGRVADQAQTLRALVAAMHYCGENRFLELAERLARRSMEHMQHADGSFQDEFRGAPDERRGQGRSIVDNAVMAEALLRLAWITREEAYEQSARRALHAFLPDYRSCGQASAAFARVVDLFCHPPVHITILGSHEEDHTRNLRAAALSPFIANRVVQTIDPKRDPGLFALAGLPEPRAKIARAYIHQGRISYAETSKPERIAALMARVERSN